MAYMEFEGLNDLIKTAERIATAAEIDKVNKNIIKKCGALTQHAAKTKAHRSKNPKQSGRKGSRTGKHMADEIPLSNIKKNKNGGLYIIVGWEKDDTSPYFYAKFEEWGTSQRPPHPFLATALEQYKKEFSKIAEEEYQRLIKDLE